MTSAAPVVGVVMGSSSDWETLQHATQILAEFGVPHEARVLSAHRMPDDMFAYAEGAAGRGLKAIIAGAGGAAHLPGMLAAKTAGAGAGRAGGQPAPAGRRFAAFHRADAQGRAGGHLCHRRGRRRQCRAVRRGHAGQRRRGACATSCSPGAHVRPKLPAPWAANSAAKPGDASPAARRGRARRPAGPARRDGWRPAGAHVRARRAGHGLWHRRARSGCRPARPGGCRTCTCRPPTTTRRAWRTWHGMRRHHHRVRERARAVAGHAGAHAAGGTGRRRPWPSASSVRPRRRTSSAAACLARRMRVLESADDLARLDATLFPGILKTTQLGYDGKGQVGVTAPRRAGRAPGTRCGACPACWNSAWRLRHEISVIVARAAERPGRAPAGAAEPAPRRHPRRDPGACARHGRRGWRPQAVAQAGRIAESMAYVGVLCVEFFVLAGRLAGGQRDGAATAQLRPLQHRRLRCLAVRTAGALPGRTAARGAAAAFGGGDAEPARRSVVCRRARLSRRRRHGTACWPCRACTCTCTARPRPGRAARWGT